MFNRNWLDRARKRYLCYIAYFGGPEKYAEAIKAKLRTGIPLDDPDAAAAFWLDHPELF